MLTLNDGRAELWQWDTGRTLAVDADCSQVHFSNKVFGRSIDVDVIDGAAIIPDVLLQTDKDLNVWAFVGTAENGYTKISKTFKVNRRNKPADYVFTPPEQTTLSELVERLGKLEESQDPDAIKNAVEDYLEQNPVEAPVQSVNGQTGTVELTYEDVGAISQGDLQEATNEVLAQAKASGEFDGADGQPGENGADGYSPTANVTQNDNGATITITDKNGTTTATVTNGKDGADGNPGADGSPGKDGADGKSAYQYAVEGGYTGTEAEFAAKLAQEMPTKLPNPNALTITGAVSGSYDGSEAMTVEIPSGGADAEREWAMLGDIDISVVGGGNIELTDLDNFTEFYATWETVINNSTTASGYSLCINDISIASMAIPILKTGSSASYGWMIARYNGLVWEFQKSAGIGSKSNVNLSNLNAAHPNNLILDVGKATKFKLTAPVSTYQAVSGIIQIYGR